VDCDDVSMIAKPSLLQSQILPQELILEIGHILAASHSYCSLGNLSLVSRTVHQDVVPLLFETMILDTAWDLYQDGREMGAAIKDSNLLPLDRWKHAR
jgi:hypothetical protein